VRIRPDGATFKPETERVLSSVDGDSAGKRIGSHFLGGMKTILAGTAAAGVGLSLFAGKFAKDAIDGYRDHNKLAQVTAQVIKTTGGAAKISAAGVGALSDAIERKSGVDGDLIQNGANLLLTFTNVRNEAGKGNQVFSRATGLLADMSVALGQDTKSSAIQLGKALNDPVKGVTALSKVGVSFTEGQKKQIKTLVDGGKTMQAQKVILKELSREFGGAAAAQVSNSDKMKVGYRTLQDTVGAQLLPVMDQFQGFLASKVLPTLTDLATTKGPAVVAFFRRVGLGVQGLYSLLVQGDFTSAFRKAFNLDEDSGTVDKLFRIRDAVIGFFDKLKSGNTGALKADFSSIGDSLVKLGPVIADAARSLPSFNDALSVGSTVMRFLADHADLLARAMPLLIAGFTAYKVLQLANNTLGRNSLVGFGLQTVATFALAASNRQLATSQIAVATAQNAAGASTGRTTIATIAQTVASKVAAGASKVWAAGQWLLNAALTANPIGLVIVAVAALVAGIVLAWQHSETFRNIVLAVWAAIRGGVGAAIAWLRVAVPAVFAWIKAAFLKYTPLGVVISHWGQIRAFIGAAVATIKGIIGWFADLPGRFRTWFGSAKDAAVGKLGDLVSWVTGLPGRVLSAIGNLGSLLFSKGADLIQGLIDGVVSKVRAVADAAASIAQKIKDFFPGSPVKEGPLTSWNDGAAGKRLGGMLASGLDSSRATVAAASRTLAGSVVSPSMAGVGGMGGGPHGGRMDLSEMSLQRLAAILSGVQTTATISPSAIDRAMGGTLR
jgi:hypothetical protein